MTTTRLPFHTMTDPALSIAVNRIKREEGVKAAKDAAREIGYAVRWDREGNFYIRDLGA